MIYTVLISAKAEADILKLRKAGERGVLRKIDALLKELENHPTTGTGHPEPLSGDRTGQWSRRITQKHRLVYQIDESRVIVLVLSAYGHYNEK
ncbi:MAG TPA: Txe/YoeB family addiction module toxin [Porphyromonadaceae bacterium]|jgi:toxin YoeB|uniref:Txe/YoeB family addiction module toxin n=1 Tax=Limibacterium fermenti TaxID=3229863 RepID=UPI000E953976|nr:Txe/YoeB family addiction module toxin [Porphyromonadaceae bacterium]HBL35036.1 Txe/YoeB family addiction module toxin [Porphyromonadaceae bacterium]HBX20626.1 Txe/YoeB family addiction module toxin [Porphyromonadaceae bacterium]HBX46501.1 Txe/YoeB family addiction module toxin [Porphyromonadaceae bacterium]HCM21473.1 Txe/YoeB family addiction module toxin [Porphyromonadaceae bacterium]